MSVCDVLGELREETSHVKVEQGYLVTDSEIIKPSHPLIPLRTVSRNAVKVARLCVDRHAVNLVGEIIRAGETARHSNVRPDHTHLEVFRRRLVRETFDLEIPETMIGE